MQPGAAHARSVLATKAKRKAAAARPPCRPSRAKLTGLWAGTSKWAARAGGLPRSSCGQARVALWDCSAP